MKTRLSKTLMSSMLVTVMLLSAFFAHGNKASETLGASLELDSQNFVTDANTSDFDFDVRPEGSETIFEERKAEETESVFEARESEETESVSEERESEETERTFEEGETEKDETGKLEDIDTAEDCPARYSGYDNQDVVPDAETPSSMYDAQLEKFEITFEEAEISEYGDIIAILEGTLPAGSDWQRLDAVINHADFRDTVQTIIIHPVDSRTEALVDNTYHLVISDVDRVDDNTIRTVGLPSNQPIAIDRNITINSGSGDIILLAGGTGRHFNVSASALMTFDGNVILNGNDTGGGIVTDNAADINLTLNNAVIRNCSSSDNGGGVLHRSGSASLTINGGEFSGNTAALNGGGIYAYNSLEIIGDTVIENNSAGSTSLTGGGGVFAYSSIGQVTISDSVIIRSNTSLANGGGIMANGPLEISDDVIIANNMANTNGGGIWAGNLLAISDDVLIENNSSSGSTGNGAGVFTDSTEQVTISDRVIIRGNTNDNGSGGIHSSGPLEISGNVIIANNIADAHGGGIWANSSLIISGDVVIENNRARLDGGGIRSWLSTHISISDNVIIRGNMSGGAGGGINTSGSIEISGAVLIESNTSGSNGGGIRSSASSNFASNLIIGPSVIFNSNSAATARNYASAIGRAGFPSINWHGQNSLGGVAAPASGTHLINNFDVSTAAVLGTLVPAGNLRAAVYHTENGTELHRSQHMPGTQVRASAAPEVREGYNFTWYAIINNSEVELAPNAAFTMPAENVLFFQRWTGTVLTVGSDWQRLDAVINHADFRDIVHTIVIHPAGSYTEARVGNTYHLVISDADRVDDYTIRTLGQLSSTPITINRNITINSSGWDITLLAEGTNRHFYVSASSVITFDGYVILNGNDTGGGIRTLTGSDINLTLNNAVIRACRANHGGGVLHESNYGTLTINGGEFSGNRANSIGGGIFSRSTAQVTIKDGVIIRDNTSYQNSGGIRADGPLEIIGDVIIANNTAENNIGGGILTNDSLTISGNVIIENNTSDWNGGGIRAMSPTEQVRISGSVIIRGNTASGDTSGAHANPRGHGGGIDAGGPLEISDDVIIENNTADLYGGGIYTRSTTAEVTIKDNVIIRGNTSTDGIGGGINASGPLEISDDVVIENNTAELNGGGFFAGRAAAQVTIKDNVVIRGNTSISGSGGGITARGPLDIHDNVMIVCNTSHINGGGIYLSAGSSVLTSGPNVIFGNNSAGTVRDYASTTGRAAFPNINWYGSNSLGGVASPAYGIHLINNFDVATVTIHGTIIPETNLRTVIFHAENGIELHSSLRLPGTQIRTMTAPETREGYIFTWYATINGNEVEFAPNTTFTMPTEDVLFFQRWSKGALAMLRIPNEVDFGTRMLGDWSWFSLLDNESNSDIEADFLQPNNMWEYGFTVENSINSPSWQIKLHATPFINVDYPSLPPGADLWAVNGTQRHSLADGFVVYTSSTAGTHSFHWAQLLREIETRALPGIHTGNYQSTFTWTLSGELP